MLTMEEQLDGSVQAFAAVKADMDGKQMEGTDIKTRR